MASQLALCNLKDRFHRLGANSKPRSVLIAALIGLAAAHSSLAQETLRARSQFLTSSVPFSFPERLVAASRDSVYILDTDLSAIFWLSTKNGKITRMCGPETLSAPSDIAVDSQGAIWVLSALRSKVFRLAQSCRIQTEFSVRRTPLKIGASAPGEVQVLTGEGDALFDVYGSDGKLLRSFGKRFDYKEQVANSELNDGRLVSDGSGGFFFSFNYPPLIRHYARSGKLIGEFKPESEVPIAPPDVSVRKQGNSVVVNSRYQIVVLDMAVDSRGRLYVLLSGKNKVPALHEGTQKLAIITSSGRVVRKANLEYNFHRLALHDGSLYLLRNRAPMRLDMLPAL